MPVLDPSTLNTPEHIGLVPYLAALLVAGVASLAHRVVQLGVAGVRAYLRRRAGGAFDDGGPVDGPTEAAKAMPLTGTSVARHAEQGAARALAAVSSISPEAVRAVNGKLDALVKELDDAATMIEQAAELVAAIAARIDEQRQALRTVGDKSLLAPVAKPVAIVVAPAIGASLQSVPEQVAVAPVQSIEAPPATSGEPTP